MGLLWVLVNILLPLALPILGPLPLLLVPPRTVSYGTAILTTVKDGQLCWGVVAMGISTTYELLEAAVKGKTIATPHAYAVVSAAVMMLCSMVVAAKGAISPVPIPATPPASWITYYQALVFSVVMAVVNALAFAYVHFTLSH